MKLYVDCDVEAMIALMHEDMQTTMPPSPTWIGGRAASEVFYRRMFASFTRGEVSVVPLGVNGQHGFAFLRGGSVRAIEVVEPRDGLIARVHHFMQPALLPLFSRQREVGHPGAGDGAVAVRDVAGAADGAELEDDLVAR